MAAPLCFTSATSTGEGRAGGRAAAGYGLLDMTLAIPSSMGGAGGATNPEQLFAAGWASCFHPAHQVCPYSVATRGNVPVTLTTTVA